MAFNFFGTFTRAQWYDFKDFASVQRTDLEARYRYIEIEIVRTGKLKCVYSSNNEPISFSAPPKSYIGKLLLAYRMLGGVPEHDMLLRNRDQVVFLNQGTSMDDDPAYSNGRINRGDQRFDRTLGLYVEHMKKWQLEAIKSKRENLEFKIKRALDYVDQLEQELEMLSDLINENTIDYQIMRVEQCMQDPGRYNTPNDVGDRQGLLVGKIGDGMNINAPLDAAEGHQRVPQGNQGSA